MDKKTFFVKYKKYVIGAACCLVLFVLSFCAGYFLLPPKELVKEPAKAATETKTEPPAQTKETADEVPPETEEKKREPFAREVVMKGIDVSKWQGDPDWKKIAESGVEFAMVRIGYHGTSGGFGLDEKADRNLRAADENGILTGVYFYSLAKDTAEAEAEALWVLEHIEDYAISMPVVLDYEMMENDASTSVADRTEIALTFLRIVQGAGYEAMLYVPIEELNDPALWEKERILEEYMVWGADYALQGEHPDGETNFAMWQYSNTGRVSGIAGNVDLNYAYFTAERVAPFAEALLTEETTEHGQNFIPANRYVTAKIRVNLRKTPSVDGELVADLKNGEYLLCTGEGDGGWARILYKGKILYATTAYLKLD